MLSRSQQSIIAAALVIGVTGGAIFAARTRDDHRAASNSTASFDEQSRLTNGFAEQNLRDIGQRAAQSALQVAPDPTTEEATNMSVQPPIQIAEINVSMENADAGVALTSASFSTPATQITDDQIDASPLANLLDAGSTLDAAVVSAPPINTALLDQEIIDEQIALQAIEFQILSTDRYDVKALLIASYAATASQLVNTQRLRASLGEDASIGE
jgi:hypothetical protein